MYIVLVCFEIVCKHARQPLGCLRFTATKKETGCWYTTADPYFGPYTMLSLEVHGINVS